MKKKFFGFRMAPIYSMADDGGAGGSGGSGAGAAESDGGQEPAKTYTQDEYNALKSQVESLGNKNQELLGNLRGVKDKLKPWEGMDPEKVKSMMEVIENNEEARLIAEGKHEEAWEKRLERVNAENCSKFDAMNKELEEFKGKYEEAVQRESKLVIDQAATQTFVQERGLETAVPDVLLRAQRTFKLEDGTPIARDEHGASIRGADGPLTVQEWVANLRVEAPHLFPQSKGAGAGGSGQSSPSDLEKRMRDAADSGDMEEYRRLRAEASK